MKKLAWCTFAAFLVYAAYMLQKNQALFYAIGGFSPMAWRAQIERPENFQNDFLQGDFYHYSKSLFMYIYPLLEKVFGLGPEPSLSLVIPFELLLATAFVVALARTLAVAPSFYVVASLVAWMVLSTAIQLNTSNFGQMFFKGLSYVAGDFFRVMGVLAFWRDRRVLSVVCFSLGFMTHPILSLLAMAFLFGSQCQEFKRIPFRNLLVVSGSTFLIYMVWFKFNFRTDTLGSGGIDSRTWFQHTSLFPNHWYPILAGVFSFDHTRAFLPFVSMFLLAIHFYRKYFGDTYSKMAMRGSLVMLVVVGLGVFFSYARISPALIKLALQRGNDMIGLFFLPLVFVGLWRNIFSSKALLSFLSLGILLAPYFIYPGFPLHFTFLLLLIDLFEKRGKGQLDRATIALALVPLLFAFVYFASGFLPAPVMDVYLGNSRFYLGVGLCSLVLYAAKSFLKIRPSTLEAILFLMVLSFSVVELQKTQLSDWHVARATDYKQVQTWARDHTATSSLFMNDPTLRNGWRDYSERSSFGTLREWIWMSVGYASMPGRVIEGKRRLSAFGISVEDYFNEKHGEERVNDLFTDLERSFYSLPDASLRNLALENGVSYTVQEKSKQLMKRVLPVAFENEMFVVYSTLQP